MRIATAAPPARRTRLPRRVDPRQQRYARLEFLSVVVVTLVVATGFWMTYRRQVSTFSDISRDLTTGALVQPGVTPPLALAERLTPFSSAAERRFAADAVNQFVREHDGITHVGALAAVTVPAREVRADARLTILRARLADRPDSTEIRLFAPSDIAAIKPALVVRSPHQYVRHAWMALAIFFAGFWFAHLARRRLGGPGDAVLLPAIQLLAGISLITMLSMRDPLRDTEAALSVAIAVGMACAAMVCVSALDFESPRFRFATGLPLAGAVALGVLLLVFGSGPGESGVKVNLWGVQPIEVIRILAVLALAAYFSRRWETVREISEQPTIAPYLRLPRWQDVSPLVVIVGTLLVFFFLQHDLGPALVLGCMSLALYGVARGRSTLVATGFAALIAGFAIGYALGVPATVARRVAIWLDPWDNGLLGGDQIAHGLWALASGSIAGLGLGVGDGQLVPAGHTDLIIAVVGEEIGLVGVMVVAALYLLVIWRILRIAARAPGDYTAFLALGCGLALAIPAIVIVAGVFGAFPLSGVVTPFLSFGKSSMICNFVAIAIVLTIARRSGPVRPQFQRQIRTVGALLAGVLVVLVADAVRIEAWQADAMAVRPSLVEQADGVARYQYNPRLVIVARRIPRGTIFDRNGLALATGDPGAAAATLARLNAAGVSAPACPAPPQRCYPLGGRGFHLLGDFNTLTNWNAPNTSFLERDQNVVLQGFDDHPRTVERQTGGNVRELVVMRDYRELLPLVRHKGEPDHPSVRRLLERPRDLTSSIDGVFQALVTRALESRVRAAGVQRGAVVVIDPDTGELLASASVPYPDLDAPLVGRASAERTSVGRTSAERTSVGRTLSGPPAASTSTGRASGSSSPSVATTVSLLDRARYGLYPPGSTFKLITAAAALRSDAASSTFMCQRLADGRIGTQIRGFRHPVRDDVTDQHAHGEVDLHKGLVVSCNAYFAQLAVRVGPQALIDAAAPTGIRIALDPVKTHLRGTLPYAGYGQGEVVASPLRMARVAGAIATDGVIRDTTTIRVEPERRDAVSHGAGTPWLTSEQASFLATSMRDVVETGTGRSLAPSPIAIAGKTGTAEVNDAPSHSWFVGFAPYATHGRRIAFAVIVENAGYGGRVAAPLAGDIVAAAQAAGVIR